MLSRRQGLFGAAALSFVPGANAGSALTRIPPNAAQGYLQGRLHIPRYGPAVCSDGARAIISGGAPVGAPRKDEHFWSSLLGLVEAVDPTTLDQHFLANAIFHRANHASVFVDGQVWLLGGRTREGTKGRLVSETERVDPATQAIWRGPDLPLPLIHLCAVTVGASVFVLGGSTLRSGAARREPVDHIWECAPPYKTWTARTPMPMALSNSAAVVMAGRIFALGGYDERRAHPITQIYDPVADTWSLGPPAPIPLSAHAAASAGGRAFIFGDYSKQSSVLGFDAATGAWRPLSPPFTPRRHVRATRVGDRIVVAGGNQASSAPATDAVESYSIAELNVAFDEAKA